MVSAKYGMDDALIDALLAEQDPEAIPFRYLSHATYRRNGGKYRVEGNDLKRLVTRDPDFYGVEDIRVFFHYDLICRDLQEEAAYIWHRIGMLVR